MEKYTPGPWIHNYGSEPQNADRHICVEDGAWLRILARVKHNEKDNAQANARLMAAAPDLLFSLKEAVASLEFWFPRWGDPEGVNSTMMNMAREAIIKAEGGGEGK